MTASTVKVAVLSLLVLQNTSLRLVMKLARTESPDFSATLAVFLCEVVKFGVAFALLARAKGVAAGAADVFAPRELARLAPPAALYLASDRLHHVSAAPAERRGVPGPEPVQGADGGVFGKLFRGRDVSGRQWAALLALAAGIAVCQLGAPATSRLSPPNPLGFACVATTSCLGAAAGTYTEAVLQRPASDASYLWRRAAQMALLGSAIAAGPAATDPRGAAGFTAAVYGVVLLNAAGGLLVAAAMKYADNVLKTLAASHSIVAAAPAKPAA
ncbi:pyrimidine nucleotide-sugar transmembrane transporter [Aureococcus anophagefferens]|nr:pyrimidine nucleotide-sugar transmembrane transporter [Aureococcus anophagefferens]